MTKDMCTIQFCAAYYMYIDNFMNYASIQV